MIGSRFLPARFRDDSPNAPRSQPGWLNQQVTSVLLSVSKKAYTHPIHTIVFASLLASTTYITLLEESLFKELGLRSGSGKVDFGSLSAGSKQLTLSPETGWKWASEDNNSSKDLGRSSHNLALLTLVFPDSTPAAPRTAPLHAHVPIPSNSSATSLPSSTNPLSPLSYDSTLAFYLSYLEASQFLASVQEIPADEQEPTEEETHGCAAETKMWIMQAARTGGRTSLRRWAKNAWTTFLDLLKNAETLDIIIMVLGYLSMHATFVSLFLSMRRLGSNFWLATTVLFSSSFAFLFGLVITTKLGIPLNMVLLSEGLPFLVVTIGFEKPIMLTKAVMSAALDARRRAETHARDGKTMKDARSEGANLLTIQDAVQTAVNEKGADIVRDYAIEIIILAAGAASGVQGGLRPFCFLAAWILFFDCILLFTFYTSILSIKLEINRIKRHVDLRKALEDDGVSRTVAELTARSEDWPATDPSEAKKGSRTGPHYYTVFGQRVRDSSIPKFKVLMVGGFILINLLNLATIPFRSSHSFLSRSPSSTFSLAGMGGKAEMDVFKVAGAGLETIAESAKTHRETTRVTIFPPIKYELEYPSVHYAIPPSNSVAGAKTSVDGDRNDQLLGGMGVGGAVVNSILGSLEDPVLSKWIIVALALSLAFNGYLFNAARWSIKEPAIQHPPPEEREMMTEPGGEEQIPGEARASASQQAAQEQQAHATELARAVATQVPVVPQPRGDRTLQEAERLVKEKQAPLVSDEELIELSVRGKIPGYALEKTLGDKTRAVKIRRALVSRTHATRDTSSLLESSLLPYERYDYDRVHGACCENVIGYMPLPVGVAGPLLIDGQNYFLPMATTEGVLVASASRGCKAINASGGATTVLTGDGMTRGPCVTFPTLTQAGQAKLWLDSEDGQKVMKAAFNSTSRFARLNQLKTAMAGTYLYIRFKTTTGDAMGMNMISKGVEHALAVMQKQAGFDNMEIVTLSANYCTDKKPAAINWIDGRGKSVVAEAIIPGDVVKSVLKTTVEALVEMNIAKNYIGSAMAGSIGGFNAHAANIVTAIFLATGQDPAQNVESSNCITVMRNNNGNLQISVSMPSIEVGTIGGGTILEPQGAMLDLLGVRGAHLTSPGDNARQLARIVAAGVLAGELSLNAALAAGHLVKAHMEHNRSAVPSRVGTPGPGTPGGANGAATPSGLGMTAAKERGTRG
ncbi:3-hydroxy-3-methylglutaryl-coenzyme A reductase [Eremomyces bilateralis CBS 781.70]|uniref:3-hydroxy-3-methylglutaryl coenzyme A reductase n=1 Tax=Eremomyces bilateralis CBS 781.70 TaxID=1392243 RepID=A0A6G1FYX3_9PEZI|nr:3-hydroxy-3-methylglutaryl-coenzyme A reductase [Eremomyces bilateralis CBS 781.70]KAF1810759.1 3-hydroxy-3-methylglutaryl-coenzyme A reductase [Eremomyces bilateralis CBS 781.70]